MIKFDPFDLFPKLTEGASTYPEAQTHSAWVDEWLDLQTERIEVELMEAKKEAPSDRQLWVGLPLRIMLTPYTEIREMLERLRPLPGSQIVDLGAGYGRMGFVIGKHYPLIKFVGYEIVDARVQECLRCLGPLQYPLVSMKTMDLSSPDFMLKAADFYFLYDFGSRADIEKTLNDLRQIAQTRNITVIGRGRSSRDAIERGQPWLSQVTKPEHFPHYSIYRSGWSLTCL